MSQLEATNHSARLKPYLVAAQHLVHCNSCQDRASRVVTVMIAQVGTFLGPHGISKDGDRDLYAINMSGGLNKRHPNQIVCL